MSQEEFRVRWQREGQKPKRALYQTAAGAVACANRQRTAREEMTWLSEPLPELVAGPTIEARTVGDWKPVTPASTLEV